MTHDNFPAASGPALESASGVTVKGDLRVGRWVAALLFVLIVVFAGIAWLQSRSLALLNVNAVYQGDNIVWSFFQLETEYLRLRELMREVSTGSSLQKSNDLRERYEVFVSRISLVEPTRTRSSMPELPVQTQAMADLHRMVEQMDKVLGPDTPESVEPQAIQALLPDFERLSPLIRDLSLQANRAVGDDMSQRNDTVRQQSWFSIWLTVFQCVLILVFAIVVVRQFHTLEQRRQALEQLARSLQEARSDAEQASRAKSAFLANMSHELRTPFNGLLGMMSLLDRSPLNPQQHEYLTVARQSGEHLLTILNDVLDFSKMESGRLELTPMPVDLRQLVRDVEALMRSQARVKSLRLEIEVAQDLRPVVQADAKRVKQILFNLLGNAIKFTDSGHVRLQLDQLHTPEGTRVTRFRVSDTGIGMNEQTLARLFQRFSQGDDSINRRFGGTGLGLEISRTLAQMMGGEITVTSQAGRGSEFTVLLPLIELDVERLADRQAQRTGAASEASASATTAQVEGVNRSASGRLQILVTDDHPVNRKFMEVLLERLGHAVRLAENGQEAVNWMQREAFDLILMDVHMPVMDGLVATQVIRKLPGPASQVTIVALTADAFAESRERVLQVGMNDFLAKPVQLHDVEELLRKYFGARAVVAVAQPEGVMALPAPAVQAPKPVRVAPSRTAAALRGRTRFKPGEASQVLNLPLISDTCAALSVQGYRSLLSRFMGDEGRTVAQVLELLEAPRFDAERCSVAAHKLKGAAANLGLQQLADAASEIESSAQTFSPEQAERAANRVREHLKVTRDLCERMGWIEAEAVSA